MLPWGKFKLRLPGAESVLVVPNGTFPLLLEGLTRGHALSWSPPGFFPSRNGSA